MRSRLNLSKNMLLHLGAILLIIVLLVAISDQKRDYFPSPDEKILSYFIDHIDGESELYKPVLQLEESEPGRFTYLHPRGSHILEGKLAPTFPHGTIVYGFITSYLGDLFSNILRTLMFVGAFFYFTRSLNHGKPLKYDILALVFYLTLPPVFINYYRSVLYDFPAITFFLLIWGGALRLIHHIKLHAINQTDPGRKWSFLHSFLIGFLILLSIYINLRSIFWIGAVAVTFLPDYFRLLKKIGLEVYVGFIIGVVLGVGINLLSNWYFYGSPTLTSYAVQALSISSTSGFELPYIFFNKDVFINNLSTYYVDLFGIFIILYLTLQIFESNKKSIQLNVVLFLISIVTTLYFSNIGGWGSRTIELTGSFLRYMLPMLLIMSVSLLCFTNFKNRSKKLFLALMVFLNIYNFGFSQFNYSTFEDSERQIEVTTKQLLESSSKETLFVTLQLDKVLFPERLVTNVWFFPGHLEQDQSGNHWIVDSEIFAARIKDSLSTPFISEIYLDPAIFYGNRAEVLRSVLSNGMQIKEIQIGNKKYIKIVE